MTGGPYQQRVTFAVWVGRMCCYTLVGTRTERLDEATPPSRYNAPIPSFAEQDTLQPPFYPTRNSPLAPRHNGRFYPVVYLDCGPPYSGYRVYCYCFPGLRCD